LAEPDQAARRPPAGDRLRNSELTRQLAGRPLNEIDTRLETEMFSGSVLHRPITSGSPYGLRGLTTPTPLQWQGRASALMFLCHGGILALPAGGRRIHARDVEVARGRAPFKADALQVRTGEIHRAARGDGLRARHGRGECSQCPPGGAKGAARVTHSESR